MNLKAYQPLNLDYVRRIVTAPPDMAVKRIGADEITGRLAVWGGQDLEGDYFTRQTDFWDDKLSFPRPLTWEHGQDDGFKARVIVGQIDGFEDDDLGRVYHAALDRAHKYRKMIDRLIEQGKLGTSSDCAPQYVTRKHTGKGYWLAQWPLFAGALTTTPAEPRLLETVHFKSLGIDLPGQAEPPASGQTLSDLAQRFALKARIINLYSKGL